MYNSKPSISTTRREERRYETLEEIKKLAWEQMENNGPSAISLREISRSMKMSSAAIYRYFNSQADLLDALSCDALQSQMDALADSIKSSDTSLSVRLVMLGVAYRSWAVQNPVRYMLVYGSPVPGYKPDWNVLTHIIRRGLETLLALIQEGLSSNQLCFPAGQPELPKGLVDKLHLLIRTRGYDMDVHALYLGIAIWSRIHGLVSLEVNGQLSLLVSVPEELYKYELESFIAGMQT